ncbi:MAG TPA: PorP/SprF family type IX secretion system membrane protein [Edaphocola sp.]|nr:PorP/SprF family type IX secretion system membrane protein [Edaphocola sp.]
MKKFILGATIVLLGVSWSATAQDAHFTQYFATPLNLNPAHTGLINTDYRVTAIARTQWYTVSNNPYVTGSISYDRQILRDKLPEGDGFGIGVNFLYDKAGTGALQSINLGLSAAYHKAFGLEKQHHLSLGVQGAFVNKSIQFDKLIFGDQIDLSRTDGFLNPTQEVLNNGNMTYPDFNAGLMYSGALTEDAMLYAGVSYYHLSRPQEKFTGNNTNANVTINSRIGGFLGGQFNLNPYTVAYLSTMYQQQGPAMEYLIGGAVGFVMNPYYDEDHQATTLYLGAWYRFGDAVAPYVGFEWGRWQLGFTYDVTLSGFGVVNQGQGALEMSAIYNGVVDKVFRKKYNFSCPKF